MINNETAIRYQWADKSAYTHLQRYHYRAGHPATVAKRVCGGPAIVAAFDDSVSGAHGGPIGVLLVSMPTLNGSWRAIAWPSLAHDAATPRTLQAARLNACVRCVSRVIVEPRWRAQGVASGLVRWYLQRSITRYTEAIASMGGVCPFFERAGMRAYHLPPTQRDARLLDALAAADEPPAHLLLAERVEELLGRAPWMQRELVRWGQASRSTRSACRGMVVVSLAAMAGRSINSQRMAYAHTAEGVAMCDKHGTAPMKSEGE